MAGVCCIASTTSGPPRQPNAPGLRPSGMPARRVATVLVLLLPVGLVGWSAPTSASDQSSASTSEALPTNVSVHVTSRQRVRLEALPPIVQYGAGVASPDAAKAAITATMKPVRV